MILFLLSYYLLFFLSLFLLVVFAIKDKKELSNGIEEKLPFVSILIAVRNEEKNIVRCLEALSKINYPKDKMEILIGNDRSEDRSREVIEKFIEGKIHFHLQDIPDDIKDLKAKANVLAQLAMVAKGEYLFITDADIAVPETWIKSMLGHCDEKTGIVSGVTITEGKGIAGKLQALEWIHAFGMIQIVSDFSIPVTAVGNNMVVSRKAYDSVGGYENIPFSLTEDFQLFKETLKKGWGFKNLFNHDVLAYSKPVENFSTLIKQRKRWMTGAFQLPFFLVLCLFIQAVFFPVVVLTLVFFPIWGVLVWAAKIILQQVYIALLMRRMQTWSGLLKYFVLFEVYAGLLSFFMLIYNILPFKVEWKGRRY